MVQIVEYLTIHALELIIVFLLIILIIGSLRKEGYLGGPLDSMNAWTSGGAQRIGGQIFSATNQAEAMVGHKDPPYYMPYFAQNYKPESYSMKTPASNIQATLKQPGKEGLSRGVAIDENYLNSMVH